MLSILSIRWSSQARPPSDTDRSEGQTEHLHFSTIIDKNTQYILRLCFLSLKKNSLLLDVFNISKPGKILNMWPLTFKPITWQIFKYFFSDSEFCFFNSRHLSKLSLAWVQKDMRFTSLPWLRIGRKWVIKAWPIWNL